MIGALGREITRGSHGRSDYTRLLVGLTLLCDLVRSGTNRAPRGGQMTLLLGV
jgi:hypothetical protein